MASIIRGPIGNPSTSGTGVRGVPFDFTDMSNRADEYVQHVRDEAAKIVQQAHAEAKQVLRNAEQAGREAAEAAIEQVLTERVGKQIDTLRPAVDGLVDGLAATRGEWLDHWQNAAVKLSVQIAERLVRKELEQRPEISEEWLREALTLAAGGSDITVRLNPNDHNHLAPKADQIAQSMGKVAGARIVADETVSPGGCVVDTRHGSVDMQLETQLDRLTEELA